MHQPPMIPRALSAIALLSAAGLAGATIEGTFVDPAVDGEGWTVEAQNDTAFLTWYTYGADGEPWFRTAICTNRYEIEVTSPLIRCEGSLFETRNGSDTQELGPFTVTFSLGPDGRAVGEVDAAGATRRIVPFEFGFLDELDTMKGIWTFTDLDDAGRAATRLASFAGQLSQLEDQTPAREFVTSEGLPGYAYFDAGSAVMVVVTDLLDGTFVVSNFDVNDDAALGVSLVVNEDFFPLQAPGIGLAKSVLNTDGEVSAYAEALGLPVFAKGERAARVRLRRVPEALLGEMSRQASAPQKGSQRPSRPRPSAPPAPRVE